MRFRVLNVIGIVIFFLLLTLITQVGGIILLCWIPIGIVIDRIMKEGLPRRVVKPLSFMGLYLISTFFLIPIIAKHFGRVALPNSSSTHIRPLTIWTCILNRHYVRPSLNQTLQKVAGQMNEKFPGTQVAYLDANFPFINGFPLIPHLSHNDGKKLDIAFFYQSVATGKQLNGETPSFIGYGIHEGPLKGEVNIPLDCATKGFWQYGFLQNLVPQGNKERMLFDHERTRRMVSLLVTQPAIGKVFIEPHLKTRMRLHSVKIRFHGCQAVRHDDHIHVQLK